MFGILAFGDSIVFGRGESPSIGWAGRLKSYFEVRGSHNSLFNLGIPGDTSSTLLERFAAELKSRIKYVYSDDKYIVLLAIGMNDSKSVGSQANIETEQNKFEKNILNLITIAKKYKAEIVIIGLTQVDEERANPIENTYFINDRIKVYDTILEKSALNEKVHYLPLFKDMSNIQQLLSDGLHPNSRGYEKIYAIVKRFLLSKKLIPK